MTKALVASLVMVAACMPQSQPPQMSPLEAMASEPGMRAPSHPPATPAQWTSAEANAASAATKAGAQQLEKPAHATGQGAFLQQRVAVVGGNCYEVGIAWEFPSQLHATVMFENMENTQLGGHAEKLAPPSGVLPFCADRSGTAVLTLSALTTSGAMAASERLEYALVVGSHKEAAADTELRRKSEGQRAVAAQATIDSNVANARAREESDRASRCKRCDEDFRACQVDASYRRSHPRPGVSVSQSCESKFTLCSHGNSYADAQRRGGDKPCGDPPR
ncbi:MAG TPA: hypothetical protein VLT33_17910 [Labilithrix sp.]|nr:hypothetical protein [Labilithrix sp.]